MLGLCISGSEKVQFFDRFLPLPLFTVLEVHPKKAIHATNITVSSVKAPVAQWIEHRIPNPGAASSILAGGTNKNKGLQILACNPFFAFV